MEKASFRTKLIDLLIRRNPQLNQQEAEALDKLRNRERLSDYEFWGIYESLQKKSPEMKYRNQAYWINRFE